MATIHAYLRQTHEDVDAANTVHYGPNDKVIITLEFANSFCKWATKIKVVAKWLPKQAKLFIGINEIHNMFTYYQVLLSCPKVMCS